MTIAVSRSQQRSPFAEAHSQARIHWPASVEPEHQSDTTGHWETRRVGQASSTKVDRMNEPASCAILFGPFRLLPRQRLLLQDGEPVRLGSRALDALIVLLGRPGQLVSKNVPISRLWPDTHVEEGNLKVQIAALRRVLGDGKDGVRYILRPIPDGATDLFPR